MTASAMIFGMMPMAIGFGEGGSQSAPLGRAVIGGLIVSTFATLTILPSIYAILQSRASIASPSLNPMDPTSRYYDAEVGQASWPVSSHMPNSLVTRRQAGRPVLLPPRHSRLARPGLAPVVSKSLSRTTELPGEFQPFLSVSLHARVPGYIERVLVDRGSVVKQGQLLAELSAPEMAAKIAEAESSVHAAESDRLQAEAQLAAAQSTWDRLKKASETPGAIAGNELTLAEKQVDAARALVSARQQSVAAAEADVRAQKVT